MASRPRRSSPPLRVDPNGPFFISYRSSDGRGLAQELAWTLRAWGVPVWRDEDDLPPGPTTRRLAEAFGGGLSGAVLVVTPQLRTSRIVKEVELPRLLECSRQDDFALLIGGTHLSASRPGRLDLGAPDRLLDPRRRRLRDFKQYPLTSPEGFARLAHDAALHRMRLFRRSGQRELLLSLETRATPRAANGSGLIVRTRRPEAGSRLPNPALWASLEPFLAALNGLLADSGVEHVRVVGPAHLTPAFALGAALPVPAQARFKVSVADQDGAVWEGAGAGLALEPERRGLGRAGLPVAVMVDLLPTLPLPGYADHLKACGDGYSASLVLASAERRLLRPAEGAATAARLATHIRNFAAEHDTHRVHLFLRTPFPVAFLLGRLLNTLETDLYEWDDRGPASRYVPVVRCASSRGGSPIVAVLQTGAQSATARPAPRTTAGGRA